MTKEELSEHFDMISTGGCQACKEIRALISRPKVTRDFIEKQSRIFYVAMLNWKETGVPFSVADVLTRIFREAGLEVEEIKEKP